MRRNILLISWRDAIGFGLTVFSAIVAMTVSTLFLGLPA
jgi:hypothetical protein